MFVLLRYGLAPARIRYNQVNPHSRTSQAVKNSAGSSFVFQFVPHPLTSHYICISSPDLARAHDQTVAEDYFAAMQRVEQRLEITPSKQEIQTDDDVKVQEHAQLLAWVDLLSLPELSQDERLEISKNLRQALFPSMPQQSLPVSFAELVQ
jgi:hypothetical protein